MSLSGLLNIWDDQNSEFLNYRYIKIFLNFESQNTTILQFYC